MSAERVTLKISVYYICIQMSQMHTNVTYVQEFCWKSSEGELILHNKKKYFSPKYKDFQRNVNIWKARWRSGQYNLVFILIFQLAKLLAKLRTHCPSPSCPCIISCRACLCVLDIAWNTQNYKFCYFQFSRHIHTCILGRSLDKCDVLDQVWTQETSDSGSRKAIAKRPLQSAWGQPFHSIPCVNSCKILQRIWKFAFCQCRDFTQAVSSWLTYIDGKMVPNLPCLMSGCNQFPAVQEDSNGPEGTSITDFKNPNVQRLKNG